MTGAATSGITLFVVAAGAASRKEEEDSQL